MNLFKKILASRGLDAGLIEDFLHPDYAKLADPFLLPDMNLAVDRIVKAYHKQEKIIIYGDYDIDGLTATTLMNDALKALGFLNISTFIPSRFDNGYGLSKSMIKKIANDKYDLIVTVDCGSLSEPEIILANELGVDVIVTDHHTVAENQPPAIAVINPKPSPKLAC
jgi:single-stranded-DNA-specific exonuclease